MNYHQTYNDNIFGCSRKKTVKKHISFYMHFLMVMPHLLSNSGGFPGFIGMRVWCFISVRGRKLIVDKSVHY